MSRCPRLAVPAGLVALAALVALLGLAPPAGAATAAPRAAAAPVPGPVVLVGTGGLTWSDVGDDTPALRGLLAAGAVATAAVRSVGTTTCPVDGWLAVSAGRRAADAPADGTRTADACRAPQAGRAPAGGPTDVPRWDEYRRQAADARFGAEPGLLGDTLAAAGRPTAAVGAGAQIALADRTGRVPAAWQGLPAPGTGSPGAGAGAGADDLALQVRDALGRGPALLVVDVGAVRAPRSGEVRAAEVRAVDERIGAVLAALPAGATVLVTSLADAAGPAALQLTAARGPAPDGGTYRPGYLRSASTRQTGLVQSTDVLPTLLTALGVPVPRQAVGAPFVAVPGPGPQARLRTVLDLAGAAETIDPVVAPFFVLLVALQLAVYAAAGLALARRLPAGPRRRRTLAVVRRVAVAGSLVPAATFLANAWPWWRSAVPAGSLTAAVLVCTLPLAAVALLGPWRRSLLGPAGVAGALTALVLTADVATGSRLSLTTLMGGQPLVAGRFYGFSNPGFALFGTGALLAAVAAAEALLARRRRRAAVAAVAGIGALATVIDVLPGLGADFGGPVALVPAFAYLGLRAAAVRPTWARAVLVGGATVALLAAVCVADWLRPPAARTHLGAFVQSVLDGDAGEIVRRKADQNLGILLSSPVNWLLPAAAVAVAVAIARPQRWHLPGLQAAYDATRLLRPGLAALGILLLLGFAANDSGTAVPPVASTVALPLLVAISFRALELREARPPREGPPAAGRPTAPGGVAARTAAPARAAGTAGPAARREPGAPPARP